MNPEFDISEDITLRSFGVPFATLTPDEWALVKHVARSDLMQGIKTLRLVAKAADIPDWGTTKCRDMLLCAKALQ